MYIITFNLHNNTGREAPIFNLHFTDEETEALGVT